ncbi:MAG: PAS domain S-box protein [Halorientalis sp.]
MDDAGRVVYLGDEERAEWVRAAFDRADDVAFAVETAPDAFVERIEAAQAPADPRLTSALADPEPRLDAVVVSDDGDWDPVAVVERVRSRDRHLPVVLFLADGSEDLARRAVDADASGYVPADGTDPATDLTAAVQSAVETHRRRRARRRERERARRILEGSPDATIVVRSGGRITYDNGRLDDVLGGDVEGLLPYERIHDEDWQALREAFYDGVIDPSREPRVEFRIRDDDGAWRTLEARGHNVTNDPVVRGMVVTLRDVSERRERERRAETYRRVVENVGDPMYVLDPDGTIRWVNEAFLDRTGYDREFVEGTHISSFLRESDLEAGAELVSELRNDDGRDWGRFEFVAENVEGDIREFEANVAVLRDEDGDFRGSVGVVRDRDSPED